MLYYNRAKYHEQNNTDTDFIYAVQILSFPPYFPPLLQLRLDHLYLLPFPQVHRILSMWYGRCSSPSPRWSKVTKRKTESPASVSKSFVDTKAL